jgi:hypothetical protein
MEDSLRIWLKRIRGKHLLTQAEIAERIGIARTTLAGYEAKASTRPIPDDVVQKLRQEFPDVEFPHAEEKKAIPPVPDILGKPLFPVGFAPVPMRYAGIVPASTEWGDPLVSEELIEVDGKYVNAKRFAATVAGDSCYPALHRGDLTIWESDPNASYGLIVLAQRKGDHGCTVKELVYDNEAGRSRLHPINPDYEDPDDGDGWGVIARLVAVVRQSDGPEKSWIYPKGLRVRHLVG